MNSNISTKWAAYAATLTAIGSSAASASVVYKSINRTLADPNTTVANSADTVCAVRFDGTTITVDAPSSAGGAVTFTAIDVNTGNTSAKTPVAGTIVGSSGYTLTPEVVQAGTVADGYLQPGSSFYLPSGDGTNVSVGVVNANKQYGWIRFNYSAAGQSITVIDAAFETVPNTPIAIGATTSTASNTTSRPSSTASLIGLSGGLTMLRRKRSEEA